MRSVAGVVIVFGFVAGCAAVLDIEPVSNPLAASSSGSDDASASSDPPVSISDPGDGGVSVSKSCPIPEAAALAPLGTKWKCEGASDCPSPFSSQQIRCSTVGVAFGPACPVAVGTDISSTCTSGRPGVLGCPVGPSGQAQLCRTPIDCASGTRCVAMNIDLDGHTVEGKVGVCVLDAGITDASVD